MVFVGENTFYKIRPQNVKCILIWFRISSSASRRQRPVHYPIKLTHLLSTTNSINSHFVLNYITIFLCLTKLGFSLPWVPHVPRTVQGRDTHPRELEDWSPVTPLPQSVWALVKKLQKKPDRSWHKSCRKQFKQRPKDTDVRLFYAVLILNFLSMYWLGACFNISLALSFRLANPLRT